MNRYRFGVRDAKIATWTTTGSYGTVYDLAAVNQIEATISTTNAELEGDDVIADTHAISTAVDVRVRFALGPNSFEVINVLTGGVLSSSGTFRYVTMAGDNMPYIGLVAQVYETSGGGDNVLFIPKAKVMEGFSYSAAYGGYVINELTLRGVLDDPYGLMRVYERVTAQAVTTIPPTMP